MRGILIAATVLISPLLASQPAAAEVIYPWCLQSSRGDRNCGFVSEAQCFASKGGNADMCMVNGLYDRVREYEPRTYAPRRSRHRG